uniref:Putative secreted peptide n=1 Tax=Anopheles braziliensis TaxID=58242 RepID=A0A2M3ZXV9_9DIPT
MMMTHLYVTTPLWCWLAGLLGVPKRNTKPRVSLGPGGTVTGYLDASTINCWCSLCYHHQPCTNASETHVRTSWHAATIIPYS